MKRLVILASVMIVSVSVISVADTVSIPFFADADATNQRAFVGLQNVSGGPIVVTVDYFAAGTLAPSAANGSTFALADGEGISYRPNTVSGAEIQPAALPDAGFPYGSMRFQTSGAVAGRYVQFESIGVFAHNLEITP